MAQPASSPRTIPVAQLLAESFLFHGLCADLVQEFVAAAQVKLFPKGKVLFLQGDEAESFYLIQSGWVKLFRETLDGTEAVIDMLPSGHMFGENAIFEDNQFSFSAEISEPTCVVQFPSELLHRSIQLHPQLALNMLNAMSRHRRQQSREIEHLSIQSAPQRIGCFLLRIAQPAPSGEITLHLPYDKLLIAARLGMRSETFSRALNKLKSDVGLVVTGSTVYCSDYTKLKRYACGACSDEYPCEDLR